LFCKAQCLSVAFRVRHGKISTFIFFYVTSFNLRYNCYRHGIKRGYPAFNRRIVAVMTVAVHFHEAIEN
jgi:hypothetical protein